ncbi:ABC transporter permease [Pigmentiphaga sp. YJ18]|uniref:ABC transporter permease n=1 Tax=Pigmentiphaga sp. YJ18 TaxID=3134907 RepID=UPI003112DFAC
MADTAWPGPLAALSRLAPRVRRGAALPAALVLLWLAVVDTSLVRTPLLVPLHQVLSSPFVDPDGRQIWAALAASLTRATAGIALGACAGVALGVALGLSRPLQRAIAPTLHGLRQVALFAWIPLLTAWFGTDEVAKVVFISLSAFFPAFLNTEQGVRAIAPAYWETAAVLRLRPWRRVTKMVLPAALPAILIGLEIALLTAWIGTVGAEYAIGVGRGLGSFLVAARELFRMDLVLAGVVALALVGYACNRASRHVFSRIITWRDR